LLSISDIESIVLISDGIESRFFFAIFLGEAEVVVRRIGCVWLLLFKSALIFVVIFASSGVFDGWKKGGLIVETGKPFGVSSGGIALNLMARLSPDVGFIPIFAFLVFNSSLVLLLLFDHFSIDLFLQPFLYAFHRILAHPVHFIDLYY
jgi:hypothetical protein